MLKLRSGVSYYFVERCVEVMGIVVGGELASSESPCKSGSVAKGAPHGTVCHARSKHPSPTTHTHPYTHTACTAMTGHHGRVSPQALPKCRNETHLFTREMPRQEFPLCSPGPGIPDIPRDRRILRVAPRRVRGEGRGHTHPPFFRDWINYARSMNRGRAEREVCWQ